MSIRHNPFFQLAYIIASLCASVTWAYLPKRDYGVETVHAAEKQFTIVSGYIGTAWSDTAATSSTLAPAWFSSTPQWSATAAASSTAAAQSSSVTPESNYQPASASPTNISPPAAYTASATTCTTYAPCNLFYQYVTVLYWPGPSQQTACLPAAMTNPPDPPGLIPQYPSLYVVFDSIIASDGCSQIGNTYSSITTSFAPGELSTIDSSGATEVFNFGDLPCGPSGDDPNYSPIIAPPAFLTGIDPAFATCIPGREQGVDPPVAIQAAGGASGLGGAGHHPGRFRRGPAHAPAVPTPS